MHLVYLANTTLPTERARGLQIMKSCEAFAGQGLDVTLYIPRAERRFKDDPFSYYRVQQVFRIEHKTCFSGIAHIIARFSERAAFYFRSIIFSASSVLSVLRFRHRRDYLFYSRDMIPLFLLSFLRLPFVAEIHDYRSRIPRWYIRWVLRRARQILVNSEGTRGALAQHYDTSDLPISTIPNGVDLGYFQIGETKEEARRILGIPTDSFVIGYVGRLETVGIEKGISELVSAFRLSVSHTPRAILYIVGGPDVLAEEYRTNVTDEFILFVGQVGYRDVPRYLRAMDTLVIPLPDNRHGRTTSPMKLFEYMAAGKPIIASDLPAIRAHLNEKNALLFPAGDIDAMARMIQFVYEHPEEAQQRSRQALQDAEHYSWSTRAAKILGLLS